MTKVRLPDEPLIHTHFKKGDVLSSNDAMLLAFEVAKKGLGKVSPNPIVGCVIVDSEHRFLASGFHSQCGAAHAEQDALQKLAATELVDATVYVTLEPCAHFGKTPPCAAALSQFKIKQVYFAIRDPNLLVNGNGQRILQKAGILCDLQSGFEELALEQNGLFLKRQKAQKKLVVGLKAAMSLDGKIAYTGDKRVWISCERSRKLAHHLRLVYDGICIGAETLIADNPELTPRNAHYGDRIPWRIVMDPNLRALTKLGLDAVNLLKTKPNQVVWIVSSSAKNHPLTLELEKFGVVVKFLDLTSESRLNLDQLANELEGLGIHSLMLEGGAGLYHDFIKQNLVDRFHLFVSPRHFYGNNGQSIYNGEELVEMGPTHSQSYICGDDIYLDIHH